jgi:hypothetical protein
VKRVFFRALLDRSGIIVLCNTCREGPSWHNESERVGPLRVLPLYCQVTGADEEWVITGVWIVVVT